MSAFWSVRTVCTTVSRAPYTSCALFTGSATTGMDAEASRYGVKFALGTLMYCVIQSKYAEYWSLLTTGRPGRPVTEPASFDAFASSTAVVSSRKRCR